MQPNISMNGPSAGINSNPLTGADISMGGNKAINPLNSNMGMGVGGNPNMGVNVNPGLPNANLSMQGNGLNGVNVSANPLNGQGVNQGVNMSVTPPNLMMNATPLGTAHVAGNANIPAGTAGK